MRVLMGLSMGAGQISIDGQLGQQIRQRLTRMDAVVRYILAQHRVDPPLQPVSFVMVAAFATLILCYRYERCDT